MTTNDLLPSRISDDEVAELQLEPALAALLAELLDHAPRQRRSWPLVVAAAASVAAVAAVPVLALDRDDPATPSPGGGWAGPSLAASATSSPSATPRVNAWQGPSRYLVLDAPGWRVTSVQTEPWYGVEISYMSGGLYLSIGWVRAEKHASLLADARTSYSQQSRQILGEQGTYFAGPSQQFAFLPVRDGYGLRVNASFTTEAEFAELLRQLRYVDAAGFDKGVPAGTVPPNQAQDVAAELLADADLPPGWTVPAVAGWNSRQGLAEQLLQPLGCAWAEAFVVARKAGDEAGQAAAIDAFAGSPDWALLAHDPGRYAISLAAMRQGGSDVEVTGSLCGISVAAPDLDSGLTLLGGTAAD